MLAKLELSVTIWSYELFMPESGVACDVVLLTSKLVNKLYEWWVTNKLADQIWGLATTTHANSATHTSRVATSAVTVKKATFDNRGMDEQLAA